MTATPGQTRPRRTAPPEERRRQLIEAAMQAIAEHGLSGARTAEIARRAGLSVGLVNHHFGSKDNLFTETLRHLGEELRARWLAIQRDRRLGAAERLAAIVEGLFHPDICAPTKIAVWFAFFGDAHYRAVYRAMAGEFDAERGLAIEEVCDALKREGGYVAVDPRALAMSLEALADGLWLSLMLYPDWLSAEAARERVFALLAAEFPRHFDRRGLRDATEAA